MFQKKIEYARVENKKLVAILFDPDKYENDFFSVGKVAEHAQICGADLILVGGSLVVNSTELFIEEIKKACNLPLFLFPGGLIQLSKNADGILLLSLVSGRNAEFLIGNHVQAAPFLKQSGLEIIPTAYVLIEGGKTTSVEYMSNTRPIPADKTEIITATALAAEMLGMKLIYLEAGSGAINHVPLQTIEAVRKKCTIPIIVGGGIKNEMHIKQICAAGADMIVIGTAIEDDANKMKSFIVAARNK